MKQKKSVLTDLLEISRERFPEKHALIKRRARALYVGYCKADKGKPRAVTMHTVDKIYPSIAFYKAVSEYTGSSEQAYAVIDEYFRGECAAVAKKLRRVCGMPFVYRAVPRLMSLIIHIFFGRKSGFEMIEHAAKSDLCHIDIVKCPYFAACSKHGCPELTTVFCDSDDVTYGNMHPKLSWDRKKTLGRGDDRCDFILRVKR